MAIAKVILNGDTLMDVTSNTVTSEVLRTGYTATGSDGETVEGAYAVRLQNKEVIHGQTDEIIGPGEDTFVFFNGEKTCTTHSNNSSGYTMSLKLKQFDISKIYYIAGNIKIVDVNNNLLDTIYINSKINNVISAHQYANIKSNNYLESIYFDWDAGNTDYSTLYYNYKAGTYGLIIKVGVFENSDEYEGLSTVLLKLNSNEIIEKAIVKRIPIYASGSTYQLQINNQSLNTNYTYTSSDIINWCNSFSSISYGQFAERPFFGNFVFNNLSSIASYGFGWNYECGKSPMGSGTINLPIISSIGIGAFVNCPWITELTASQCISIGQSAFKMCMSLHNIELPLCQTIGSNAFYYTNLTTLNLPSCISINSTAFAACSSLTSINLPKCTYIGAGAFQGDCNLVNINIPSCITISSYAFRSCSSLISISASQCVTIGANAFEGCSALTATNFSSCVTIGNYAFSKCYSLVNISLPVCQSLSIGVFYSCSALTEVNLPLCEYVGSSAFYSCGDLTTIYLPKCTYIQTRAFGYCSKLVSLYITSVSSVPTLADHMAFYYTPIGGYYGISDAYIYVPASLYNDFLIATNWSSISSRIVSV